jgi:hypothetical protein
VTKYGWDQRIHQSRLSGLFKSGSNVDQPSNDSGEVSIAGKNYVVLRNVRGIMAVYRVRNDGALKRLKRWPEGLN